MVQAERLVARIARQLGEVVVQIDQRSVEGVFDDRLRLRNGLELLGGFLELLLGGGDVDAEGDDLARRAVSPENRRVEDLQPDLSAIRVDALGLLREGFAARDLAEKRLVFRAGGEGGRDERAVVLALDRGEVALHQRAVDFIGGEDRPVERQLEIRLLVAHRVENRFCVAAEVEKIH